jgi:hypothetical protein
MPTYEIEHKWSNEQTKIVVEKVQAAIASAKKGQVPAGFRPISIVAIPGKTEAHCLWEAPSAESLEGVYTSLGVPTVRTIREVTPFFTA